MTDDVLEVETIEDATTETASDEERLRDIFQARRTVRKQRMRAKNVRGTRDERVGRRMYRAAVEGYAREAEPLLIQTDSGQELWSDRNFTAFSVGPDFIKRIDSSVFYEINGEKYQVKNERDMREVTIEPTGVKSLFSLGDPIQIEYKFEEKIGLSRTTTRRETVRAQIPPEVLDEIVSALNLELADMGISINVDEETGQTKIDSSLIQEVETWRRENL